jgi:hypothetical protein
MEKHTLTWRSFTDRGTIGPKWNHPATPGYYVLDHRGVIRHKWAGNPGEKAMDARLEELIREANEAAR